MRLLCGSINVRERPWASKRQPIDYKRCCTDRLNAHLKSGYSRTRRCQNRKFAGLILDHLSIAITMGTAPLNVLDTVSQKGRWDDNAPTPQYDDERADTMEASCARN